MEATGQGALGPSQLGVHHIGFAGADPERRIAELAGRGIGHDGHALDERGRMLVCFTDEAALDGLRLEFVSALPNPIVADDGSPLPRDPATGRVDIWARALGCPRTRATAEPTEHPLPGGHP
jgi:hypothetical protein